MVCLVLQGIFLTQGSNLHLRSLALAGGFFTSGPTWEAPLIPYDPPIPLLDIYLKKMKVLNSNKHMVTKGTVEWSDTLSVWD